MLRLPAGSVVAWWTAMTLGCAFVGEYKLPARDMYLDDSELPAKGQVESLPALATFGLQELDRLHPQW